MLITVQGREIPFPDADCTVRQIVEKLQRFLGTNEDPTGGVNTEDEISLNGIVVDDLDIQIPENARLEFRSATIKVVKSVGSYVEAETPYVASATIKETIIKALESVGSSIEFTDQIQVIEFSRIPTLYTLGQLNEKISKGAILKITPYGKDTSGN